MSKERPIIFSGPMVRALLDGRKTQTRRLVKPQPTTEPLPREEWGQRLGLAPLGPSLFPFCRPDDEHANYAIACTYGVPGELLWVKETWQAVHFCTDPETGHVDDIDHAPKIPKDTQNGWWRAVYAADDEAKWEPHRDDRGFPWRPSIFMPRWASRITLEVTEVRVQRLQEISEEDAIAEGVDPFFARFPEIGRDQRLTTGDLASDAEHRASFAVLWDEINGDRALWSASPWVWCISFKRAA